MIDLALEAQIAVFTALKNLPTDSAVVAALGTQNLGVFQHVPENTQPPYLVIGQISSMSDFENYDQFEQITFEIIAVYRGMGRAPLMKILHSARLLIENQNLSTASAAFQTPRMKDYQVSESIADGQTYIAGESAV
jgi:hypothetical protein